MAALPPNDFSQHLAKWVYQKTLPSVVLVTFSPSSPNQVKQHIDQMYPNENPSTRKGNAKRRREESLQERCATGFVVEAAEDHLLVLTCAHSLDHVFSDSSPITPDAISALFNARILCDHAESRHRLDAVERQWVPAVVVQADCKTDLLLLRVELAMLTHRCEELHPALPIANSFPDSLDKVVVVSWPPYRPRTTCMGVTSHQARDYSDVFDHNPYGYNMALPEVSVLTDTGSSGAPMLNGDANVVGALHGGYKSSLCYFTSLPDLRNVLTAWGVIGNAEQ